MAKKKDDTQPVPAQTPANTRSEREQKFLRKLRDEKLKKKG